MSEIELRPADAADRDAVLALMEDVWGSRPTAGSYDWWFEQSPSGRGLVSVAVLEGRIAGVAAMSWLRMHTGDAIVRVPFSLHVATHPAARGRGVFQALELENEPRAADEGARYALTFPNAATEPIFLGRLGWVSLPGPRMWIRPVNPWQIVRRRADEGPVALRDGPGAGEASEIPARGAALWERARDRDASSVVRDAAHLAWRYESPERHYRPVTVTGVDGLAGLAVTGAARLHGVAAVTLADVVVQRGDTRTLRRLLRAVRREAGGELNAVLALEPPDWARGAFFRSGFLPTHRRVRFLAKALVDGAEIPERFAFTLGDMDFV
jgi:GNAT superfamily N-acetyltransferase